MRNLHETEPVLSGSADKQIQRQGKCIANYLDLDRDAGDHVIHGALELIPSNPGDLQHTVAHTNAAPLRGTAGTQRRGPRN